ncbi:hypothetical protein DPMN_114692 [Dreissena polymorpha]|uniref:Uncharacterized protein n=1 Tax=Dreissena polymorpha TaxID=45954 RepID=A0A9D4KKK1_DREPO|nr:hypothetical protein DPMN_114692 [Dreissena polymorpha]
MPCQRTSVVQTPDARKIIQHEQLLKYPNKDFPYRKANDNPYQNNAWTTRALPLICRKISGGQIGGRQDSKRKISIIKDAKCSEFPEKRRSISIANYENIIEKQIDLSHGFTVALKKQHPRPKLSMPPVKNAIGVDQITHCDEQSASITNYENFIEKQNDLSHVFTVGLKNQQPRPKVSMPPIKNTIGVDLIPYNDENSTNIANYENIIEKQIDLSRVLAVGLNERNPIPKLAMPQVNHAIGVDQITHDDVHVAAINARSKTPAGRTSTVFKPKPCWCLRCLFMNSMYFNGDPRLEMWGNYPCFGR